MGAEHTVDKLERSVNQLELRTTRMNGKLDTIGVQIQSNTDQRDVMQATLDKIESHLRELNGRTRKSEDAVAELRFNQQNLLGELARALKTQPDGTLQVVTPPADAEERPPLTKGQKAGMAGLGVTMVFGLIELLKHAMDLGAALLAKK
jgi:septal ring factor EnvC (AmiA/AmiB activator)